MSLWWPGEWDRVITKVEDWILKRNGYNKLQPCRLSRGYQSLMTKPRGTDRVCTTFRFPVANTQIGDPGNELNKRPITHQPSSTEVSSATPLQYCVSSLDKMEKTLKQYERAFAKLPKRGPKFPGQIYNQNLDILNEEMIQSMFLKCYSVRRIEHEIATSKV